MILEAIAGIVTRPVPAGPELDQEYVFGIGGKCVIIFRPLTTRVPMRLTNNQFVGMSATATAKATARSRRSASREGGCPSTPPFTGAADARIFAGISVDWLKDAGTTG